jgi:hypothetical protein
MPTAVEYERSRAYYKEANKRTYKRLKNWFADYHQKHKTKRATQIRGYHWKRDEFIHRFKESKPCADCLEFFPYYVMHFDHRPGTAKLGDISRIKWCGKAALYAEIQKCDLVCANCHSRRTWKRKKCASM